MQKTEHIVFLIIYCLLAVTLPAQYGPSSVDIVNTIVVPGGTRNYVLTSHAASVNTVKPSQNYTLNYNNSANVRVNGFNMGGNSYVNFALFDTIFFRRAANAWETTGGDKQHIYTEGPTNLDNTTYTLNMTVAYPFSTTQQYMMRAIRDGYINRGSDNVFNNDSTSDLTYNNIERADFIYRLGLASLDVAKAGFLIVERGGNDAFKISAITAIDGSGNPTAFGPVLPVPTGAWGSSVHSAFTYVMRKDAGDNDLRLFSRVPNQQIKSVFITFQDLGVSALQKIYGYALMGNDVTAATSAQVLNFTNTTYFPRTTNNANGGLDLSAAPGIFHTSMVLAGRFFEFKYQKKNCGVVLYANDPRFAEVKEYVIEKSYNQVQFETLKAQSANTANFTFTDEKIKAPVFYRIKIIPRNGEYFYSEILYVTDVCGTGAVAVYPNPVKDRLTISTSGSNPLQHIALRSFNGSVVGNWTVTNQAKITQLDLSALGAGQYMLVLTYENNQREVHKILKK